MTNRGQLTRYDDPANVERIAGQMRNFANSGAEWLAYLVVALSTVSAGLLAGSVMVGDGIDMYGTVWFYWWIDHALSNGINPGGTDLMFHPYGKDIFGHTGGNFLDALVSVPFQRILGQPNFQPWFIACVIMGNAVAFRHLLSGLGMTGWARFTGTALWMSNPFILFELLTGRITQAFLIFLPIALLAFIRIPQGRWRDPIIAGVFTGLQAWTYWFMGWFMAAGFVVLAGRQIATQNVSLRFLTKRWLLSGLSCLAVVGPAWRAMSLRTNQGDVPGLGVAQGWAGFIDMVSGGRLPTLQGWIHTEQAGVYFFGYPLWFVLALLVIVQVRTRWTWGVFSIVAMAFAVGPSLVIVGGVEWPMPHYLFAVHFLPFVERLWFPYRWIVMAFLGVCVGIAVLLQHNHTSRKPLGRIAMLGLIVTSLWAQADQGVFPLKTRAWSVPRVLMEIGQRSGGIIELPLMVPRASLMYQTVHQQPLFGGMGENASVFWPKGFKHQLGKPFIRALRMAILTPEKLETHWPADIETVKTNGMRWIVLDRHALFRVVATLDWWDRRPEMRRQTADRVVERVTSMVGAPVAVEGELVVWDLYGGPEFGGDLVPSASRVASEEWMGTDWDTYIEALRGPDEP